MTRKEFFQRLYGDAPGNLYQGFWQKKTKSTIWATVEEILSNDIIFSENDDIYFHVNLQLRALPKRGTTKNAAWCPGVWLDVDTKEGADAGGHKAEGVYPTKPQALEVLIQLAEPDILVDSGGGYQGYWLSPDHDPSTIGQVCQDWTERINREWIKRGWVPLDSTFDLARLFRVPETLNAKYNPKRKVTIHEIRKNS
jgi:hypothetical protein